MNNIEPISEDRTIIKSVKCPDCGHNTYIRIIIEYDTNAAMWDTDKCDKCPHEFTDHEVEWAAQIL